MHCTVLLRLLRLIFKLNSTLPLNFKHCELRNLLVSFFVSIFFFRSFSLLSRRLCSISTMLCSPSPSHVLRCSTPLISTPICVSRRIVLRFIHEYLCGSSSHQRNRKEGDNTYKINHKHYTYQQQIPVLLMGLVKVPMPKELCPTLVMAPRRQRL